MRDPDIISGIFWLCLGLLLSLWSTWYRIGNLIQPGAGFVPLILGLLLIILSLVLLVQAKKSSPSPERPPSPLLQRGWKKVVYAVALMVLAIFFFETLGYLLTFLFLLILLMRGTGTQKWSTTLLIAFFSVLSVYLIFVLLLKQQLPKGLLGI